MNDYDTLRVMANQRRAQADRVWDEGDHMRAHLLHDLARQLMAVAGSYRVDLEEEA